MNLQSILPSLAAAGLLAACQVTGTTQDPDRADEAANPTQSTKPEPSSGSNAATATTAYSASEASSRTYQEPRPTSSAARGNWGPGTMHIAFGGNFVNDQTQDEPSDPGDDIETMDLEAEVGRLLTDRFEINVQATYHEADIGVDDVNRTGLFGGLRFYVATPDEDQDIGIYAEGKAGVLSVDSPDRDDQEFAYGGSVGALWWPWGIERGMAIDVSVDILESDVIDRVGASAGLSYFW